VLPQPQPPLTEGDRVGIAVGVLVLFLFLVGVLVVRYRRRLSALFARFRRNRSSMNPYDGISGTGASPSQPTAIDPVSYAIVSPDQYTIAIVCAMKHEFDPIKALFDGGVSHIYRRPPDQNIYIVGRFADHHTVLMMPGDKGELDAGMCTQRLRDHFQKIELTLLVGICGAMSQNNEAEEPIYLGDVIVGTRVWRYLYDARSSQLQSGGVNLELRNLVTESASQQVKQLGNLLTTEDFRKDTIESSFDYLQFLQGREGGDKYKYPGRRSDESPPDKLFKSDCLHRHRSSDLQCSCADPAKSNCKVAKDTRCKALGCERDGIERMRTQTEEPPKPNIHVGTIASADVVMRALSEFTADFNTHNVLGVDMEGGGVSKATDCIVIKGAVDYADTHKNKDFARYAAAAAASVAKAFLMILYRGTTSM
jgi:nucleoside phosphorylase